MLIQNFQINLFKLSQMLLLVMLLCFSACSWADDFNSTTTVAVNTTNTNSTTQTARPDNLRSGVAIGAVANNLLEPVTIASGFLSGVAFVLGVTSLFSAFLRYKHHRNNPLAYPISTIIVLFVLGLLLVLLPFMYKLTDSGIPFSF